MTNHILPRTHCKDESLWIWMPYVLDPSKYMTILAIRASGTLAESSNWDIFKSYMYIYFLKAYKKASKVIRLNFVSGCSFCYIGHLNRANFDELWTSHFCIDRQMNNIYRIYIELSLICDQSQLSSSIRLEMTSDRKRGATRFLRNLAKWSTNFTC